MSTVASMSTQGIDRVFRGQCRKPERARRSEGLGFGAKGLVAGERGEATSLDRRDHCLVGIDPYHCDSGVRASAQVQADFLKARDPLAPWSRDLV